MIAHLEISAKTRSLHLVYSIQLLRPIVQGFFYSWQRMNSRSSLMNSSLCNVATLETALEKHINLKCPFFLQLWQIARLAGQDCLGCGLFPHLWHLLERLGLDLGLPVGSFLLAFHVDFQEWRLGCRTKSTVFPWLPLQNSLLLLYTLSLSYFPFSLIKSQVWVHLHPFRKSFVPDTDDYSVSNKLVFQCTKFTRFC